MWINKKFKCKGTMSTSPSCEPYDWKEEFIEGKWYNCSYKTWSNDPIENIESYKRNGGWNGYKAISEYGVELKFDRAHFNIVFYTTVDEIRESLINEITE